MRTDMSLGSYSEAATVTATRRAATDASVGPGKQLTGRGKGGGGWTIAKMPSNSKGRRGASERGKAKAMKTREKWLAAGS